MISTAKSTLSTRSIFLKSYTLNNTSVFSENCILTELSDAKQNSMYHVLTKCRFTWNVAY